MPDDSSGNFSLTPGYLATPGSTILASQHNPPLEDIASAMTGRLPRSGSAPMGGPLKTVNGSVANPAIHPNGNPAVGIYFTATGTAFAGSVQGMYHIGQLIPTTVTAAQPLTVLPYGQTLLRSAYPDLWTTAQAEIALGNASYNNGDGSTTFGILDARGRVPAGWDKMGGTAAGRLTATGSGVNGSVIGSVGGGEAVALSLAQIPSHTHSGTTGAMNANASHSHPYDRPSQDPTGTSGFGSNPPPNGYGKIYPGTATGSTNTDHGHPFTTDGGSGLSGFAHLNTQPTFVCNFLLFAGA